MLLKRHAETGNHDVNGFHHLRPIGPSLNPMESSMKAWPSPHPMKTAVSAIFVGMCGARRDDVQWRCCSFRSGHAGWMMR